MEAFVPDRQFYICNPAEVCIRHVADPDNATGALDSLGTDRANSMVPVQEDYPIPVERDTCKMYGFCHDKLVTGLQELHGCSRQTAGREIKRAEQERRPVRRSGLLPGVDIEYPKGGGPADPARLADLGGGDNRAQHMAEDWRNRTRE